MPSHPPQSSNPERKATRETEKVMPPPLPLYGPLRHRFREKPKQNKPNFLLPSASSWKEDRDSRSYTSRGTATTIAVGYTLESREPPSDGGGHHSVQQQQQQQQRDDCDDNTHPTPNGVQESCVGGGGASIGGDVVDEGVSKKPPTRIATADIAHCGEVESSGIEESVSKEPTRTMTAEGATTGGGVGPSGIEEGVSKEPTRTMTAEGATGGGVGPSGIEVGVSKEPTRTMTAEGTTGGGVGPSGTDGEASDEPMQKETADVTHGGGVGPSGIAESATDEPMLRKETADGTIVNHSNTAGEARSDWARAPSLVLNDFPPGMTSVDIHIQIDHPSTAKSVRQHRVHEIPDTSSVIGTNVPLDLFHSSSGSQATVKTGTKYCDKEDAVDSIGSVVGNRRQPSHKSAETKMKKHRAKESASAVTPPKHGIGRKPPIACNDSTTSCSTESTAQSNEEHSLHDIKTWPSVQSGDSVQSLDTGLKTLGKHLPFENSGRKKKNAARYRSLFPRGKPRKKSAVCDGELALDMSKSMDKASASCTQKSRCNNENPVENSESRVTPLLSLGVEGGGVSRDAVEQSESTSSPAIATAGGLLNDAAVKSQIISSTSPLLVNEAAGKPEVSAPTPISSSAPQLSVNEAAGKPEESAPTPDESRVKVNDVIVNNNISTTDTTKDDSSVPACCLFDILEDFIETTCWATPKCQPEIVSVSDNDFDGEVRKQLISQPHEDSSPTESQGASGLDHRDPIAKVLDDVVSTNVEKKKNGEAGYKQHIASMDNTVTVKTQANRPRENFEENASETENDAVSTRTAETLSKIDLALHQLERRVAPHIAVVQGEISSLKKSERRDGSCFQKLAYASLLETVEANIAEMKAVTSQHTKQRKLVDSENSVEEKMEDYFNLVEKALREQNELERTLSHLLVRIEKHTRPNDHVEPVTKVDSALPPAMRNK